MKKFWKDFKSFITRGNVVDLAVAVVVGGAFGKIVTSLVADIIMPLISLATGGADFTDWKWVIKKATASKAEVALNYGVFLQTIIDFIIIAFFIFLVLWLLTKARNKAEQLSKKGKEVAKPESVPVKPTTDELLIEIRDLLKQKNVTGTEITSIKTENAIEKPKSKVIVDKKKTKK